MSVIFTPYALSSLLEFITIPAMYGGCAHKGESVYSDKVGETITTEELSIVEDSTLPGGLNSAAVDDEGVPSKRTELVSDGVLQSYLYDLSTAIEFDQTPTSSGLRTERLAGGRSFKALPCTKSRMACYTERAICTARSCRGVASWVSSP